MAGALEQSAGRRDTRCLDPRRRGDPHLVMRQPREVPRTESRTRRQVRNGMICRRVRRDVRGDDHLPLTDAQNDRTAPAGNDQCLGVLGVERGDAIGPRDHA